LRQIGETADSATAADGFQFLVQSTILGGELPVTRKTRIAVFRGLFRICKKFLPDFMSAIGPTLLEGRR
jgi:hypothetical protein